jgi:hypothetical protein
VFDKHSSLLARSISEEEQREFYNSGAWNSSKVLMKPSSESLEDCSASKFDISRMRAESFWQKRMFRPVKPFVRNLR